MKNAGRQAQRGMVLIEAMVALVVMAAGILGIAKLNTFFIEVSGQAKARTQAVQLAEGKLEELRSLMVRSQFDAIAGDCDSVYGMSASGVQATAFERCWTTTPDPITEDDDHAEVTVLVSWTDRMNIEQTVDVRSVVAWNDPGKAIALVKPGEAAGSHAQTPTGRARLGDGTRPVDTSVTPNADGLRQQKDTDNIWRLVDANGNVLLTALREDERFSEIAGNVYIDQNNLSSLNNEDVYIVISDASFCSMTPGKNPVSPTPPPYYQSPSTIYRTFAYRCYLGANWFGNIGVIRTDSANTNDRVCLGDPAVTAVAANVKSDNRHPALGTSRMYRGYVSAGAFFKSTGIGVQSSNTDTYTAAVYDGHDFLLTRITGNPVDGDCSAKLRLYDNTSPYQPFSTDAVTHTGVQPVSASLAPTETAYLNGGATAVLGNPGKFFCFTTTCPDPLPNAAAPQITISITGKVRRSPTTGSGKPTIVSMTTNSGSCTTLPSWSGSAELSDTYTCSFTGAGFTGGSWSGSITVTTGSGQYICPNTTTGSASPLPAAPSTATATTYTFNFTNQSVSAGNSEFNFSIGGAGPTCPTP